MSTAATANDATSETHRHHETPAAQYTRAVGEYRVPDVELVDRGGRAVALRPLLEQDGPVLVQLIFTTCPAVCPVLSASFAAIQGRLDEQYPDARLVSITVDPEHDTPARLRAYAERFRAGDRWRLLTGARADVVAVQHAFDAFRANKMQHLPLTFLRADADAPWVRLEGFPSAAELLAELERLPAR